MSDRAKDWNSSDSNLEAKHLDRHRMRSSPLLPRSSPADAGVPAYILRLQLDLSDEDQSYASETPDSRESSDSDSRTARMQAIRALSGNRDLQSNRDTHLGRPRSISAIPAHTVPRLEMLPRHGVVDEVGVEVELLSSDPRMKGHGHGHGHSHSHNQTRSIDGMRAHRRHGSDGPRLPSHETAPHPEGGIGGADRHVRAGTHNNREEDKDEDKTNPSAALAPTHDSALAPAQPEPISGMGKGTGTGIGTGRPVRGRGRGRGKALV